MGAFSFTYAKNKICPTPRLQDELHVVTSMFSFYVSCLSNSLTAKGKHFRMFLFFVAFYNNILLHLFLVASFDVDHPNRSGGEGGAKRARRPRSNWSSCGVSMVWSPSGGTSLQSHPKKVTKSRVKRIRDTSMLVQRPQDSHQT